MDEYPEEATGFAKLVANWRFRQWVLLNNLDKLCDTVLMAIAWRLPDRLVMWCYIRVASYATTGQYSNTEVPALTVMDALGRWQEKGRQG